MLKLENFASDLHKKGEYEKIESMEKLQKQIEQETNSSLTGAFLTNGIYGKYDCIAIIANKKEYEHKQGYIVFDNAQNKALFINENELD